MNDCDDLSEKYQDYSYMWPNIFSAVDYQSYADSKSDSEICAIGLVAWANCMAGLGPIPEKFGEVMVILASRLKISGTPESFFDWSTNYRSKNKPASLQEMSDFLDKAESIINKNDQEVLDNAVERQSTPEWN